MTDPAQLGWYWHRLRAMAPAEMVARLLEKVRGSADPVAARVLADFRLGSPDHRWPPLPDRSVAPETVRKAVAIEARAIREGKWLLFGWKEVRVPDPPVWNRDFVNDADAPRDVAARHLNHRQLAGGADARCVWEANRWAEVVRLAQNAWLNRVVDDALLAQRWVLGWCDANPLGMGINWCSPLEAAVRLVNFCWIDAMVRACDAANLASIQDEVAQRVVPSHAWWIWRHRSFGSSANNHLLGELCGLILAGRRWPSLAGTACSAERAWQLMSQEVLRQFEADGGNREQALHYHQLAWEMAWQAQRVMEGGPGPVSDRLHQAATFFCDLEHDRDPWDFGDSDDAQITPLTSERRTAGAEWRAWLLGDQQGEALRFWLGSPPSVSRLSPGAWKPYPLSGLAVQEVNGWKARVDGSPLGFGRMAAHGHLDAMHVSLWDGEHAVLIDPGTGTYFADAQVRARLASWESHNGPMPVGGRATPRRSGPFLWTNHHAAPQLAVSGDEACTVAFAIEGVHLKRTVQYVAMADAWRITDEVAAEEVHAIRWRLGPKWRPASRSAREITAVCANGNTVRLRIESDEVIAVDVSEDLVSSRYGLVERGMVITVTFKKRLTSQWQRLTASGDR